MKVGAYFLPVELDTFLESVKTADRVGYTRAWIPDSQMIWQDPYVYMARGLEATQRLAFGTAVTNPITRHFSVTASGHATLAQIHPGRVILGLGRGDSSIRTLGLRPMSVREMREVVLRIRALARGEPVLLDGTEIRITWANEPLPIMVAGTGPRTMQLAGALADIVTLELGVNPAAVKWALENVWRGAEEVGRDPAELEIVVLCGMWVSDDLGEAREQCRWAPASATNHIAEVMHNNPDHGMPPELTRLVEVRRRLVPIPSDGAAAGVPSLDGTYDYYGGHCENDAEHARWIPDDIIDDFTLAGPADVVIERARRLASLGVHEIAPAFMNRAFAQMELVGREVIPQLQLVGARSQGDRRRS